MQCCARRATFRRARVQGRSTRPPRRIRGRVHEEAAAPPRRIREAAAAPPRRIRGRVHEAAAAAPRRIRGRSTRPQRRRRVRGRFFSFEAVIAPSGESRRGPPRRRGIAAVCPRSAISARSFFFSQAGESAPRRRRVQTAGSTASGVHARAAAVPRGDRARRLDVLASYEGSATRRERVMILRPGFSVRTGARGAASGVAGCPVTRRRVWRARASDPRGFARPATGVQARALDRLSIESVPAISKLRVAPAAGRPAPPGAAAGQRRSIRPRGGGRRTSCTPSGTSQVTGRRNGCSCLAGCSPRTSTRTSERALRQRTRVRGVVACLANLQQDFAFVAIFVGVPRRRPPDRR